MYKRIDQPTLIKYGLKSKQLLVEEAIDTVHQFSMLQRFRQNKDFKAIDKTKPLPVPQSDSESSDEEDENNNRQNFAKPIVTA